MIIKYNQPNNKILADLTRGKEYHVISVELGWYRIHDDSGVDYLYPPELFEIIDDSDRASITTHKTPKKIDRSYYETLD